MDIKVIGEAFLIALAGGVYTLIAILYGYLMGRQGRKITFIKGDPVIDPEDIPKRTSSPEDEQDPYDLALNGPLNLREDE